MKRTPGFWFAIAACVVVAAAVVGGLLTVGGPGEGRLEKLDAARLDDLRTIERAVVEKWDRTGALPPSLDSLHAANLLLADDLVDPETSERYAYRVLSDSTAELCATFARASDDRAYRPYDRTSIGVHDAGRHCFTVQPGWKQNRRIGPRVSPPADESVR